MPDLEELYVRLNKDVDDPVADNDIFSPMRAITRVRDFQVEMTWTAQYDWSGVPFVLRDLTPIGCNS